MPAGKERRQEKMIIICIMITTVIFSVLMGMLIGIDWLLDQSDPISIMLIIGYAILIIGLTYTAYRL